MRAEDRDAVRVLLAAQEQNRAKPDVKKKAPPPKKKRPDKWWTTSSEVDPISLEPLAELERGAAFLPRRASRRERADGRP